MKLFEMRGNLPKRAGLAKLAYSEKTEEPTIKNGLITLPLNIESEFYPLKNGEQFLFSIKYRYSPDGRKRYFGGTDIKNVFMSVISPAAFNKYAAEGEKEFYESLIHLGAKQCAKYFHSEILRQGNLFAVPCGPNLYTEISSALIKINQMLGWQKFSVFTKSVNNEALDFNCILGHTSTRHKLNGTELHVLDNDQEFPELFGRSKNIIVARGTVTAPRYEPLKLKEFSVLCCKLASN